MVVNQKGLDIGMSDGEKAKVSFKTNSNRRLGEAEYSKISVDGRA